MKDYYPLIIFGLSILTINFGARNYKNYEEKESLKSQLAKCEAETVLDKIKEKFPQK